MEKEINCLNFKGLLEYPQVKSKPGRGTLFELYFPITRRESPGAPSGIPLESFLGRQETILVVADVKEQREIAVSMLTRLNYQAFSVAGGKEALRFLRERPADLLLLDLILEPGLNGMDLYKQILEFYPGQKAVIASGFSETDRVAEARQLGTGGNLKKPYTLRKLASAVKEELTGSGKG